MAAARVPVNYDSLLQKWLTYGQNCSGSGIYEARLAMAYGLANRLDEARQVLRVADRNSPYRYLLEFADLFVDGQAALAGGNGTREDVARLEQRFAKHVQRHPDHAEAFAMLGGLQVMLGRNAEAIVSLKKALDSPMEKWGIYRNLAEAYAEVGEYQLSLDAANHANSLTEGLTADPFLMLALAKAEAGLGKFDMARNALVVAAGKNPGFDQTPAFRQAAQFVQNKQAESTGHSKSGR